MATWNERIDNLQARLANLVSEEFAGANFYNTNIAVSDYNPTIDTTVTLTITVTNAEGDPVEGASVPVTASEGQFTKLNNTTITAASSVTGTTNSSGQFTLTYSCTEWGLITFSANNTNIQARVNGWRTVDIGVSYATFTVNEGENLCRLWYYQQNYNFDNTAFKTLGSGVIPSKYRKLEIGSTNDPAMSFMLNNNGDIQAKSNTTGSRTIHASAMWSY